METAQNMEKVRELMDIKHKQILSEVTEMVEREMEIFEFNIFISLLGKKKLDNATKAVESLKKDVKQGKIDLRRYEQFAEEF